MKYKAVLFDLDGTLLSSKGVIGRSINLTLEQFGIEPFNQEELRGLIGIPLRRIFSLKTQYNQDMIVRYREIYLSTYLEGTEIYDGMKSLLENLKSNNMKIGIITLKDTDVATEVLRGLNLIDMVDVVIGDEEEIMVKPFPDQIIHACRKLKISPKECVMVGDTEFDIIAGKKAHCITIGVLWGASSKEPLLKAGVDFIVDSAEELNELLLTSRGS